jgi:hypothetical protein
MADQLLGPVSLATESCLRFPNGNSALPAKQFRIFMNTPETHVPTSAMLDNVISEADYDLQQLRRCLVDYFLLCVEHSKLKVFHRRPPFALRLPHGDFIFVAKPTTNKCNGIVTISDGIHIESLRVADDRRLGSTLNLTIKPMSTRKTRWLSDYAKSIDAAENLVELTKYFLIFPQLVFAKSKDCCCCCGRHLTDEQSRCRGIGPECLKVATELWKNWVDTPPPQSQQKWRSIYEE